MALRLLAAADRRAHRRHRSDLSAHENEIAQSEAATGKEFARFWMHVEYLLVD